MGACMHVLCQHRAICRPRHDWTSQCKLVGNFMLLSEDEASPLRAIDFGLAVPYDSEHLPRSDLGLEGTPW